MATRHIGSETSAPPRKLGRAGKDLWERINMDYVLADETERESLTQVCEAADQILVLTAAIEAEGAILENNKGQRHVNGAFTVVRQYRGFILRALERLKSHHNKTTKVLGRPARTSMGYDPFEMEEQA